jgi:hypothetical protein
MATNAIRYSLSTSLSNGFLSDNYSVSSGLTADQTNANMVRKTQTLLSASAQGDLLDIGGVTVPGMAIFSNLEAVVGGNFCEIGIQVSGTFYPFLKLLGGQQSGPMFLGATTIYGRANTGNVKLFYIIYDR